MNQIIDSHAHIDEIDDLPDAIVNAKNAGVIAIIAPGQDLISNKTILKMSNIYQDYIHPAIGYHPFKIHMSEHETVLHEIDKALPEATALGEVGLDYKAKTKKRDQKEIFRLLLELAKKHEKPVIVHTRYVHETSFLMVKEAGVERAVFHAYNGSLDILGQIVDAGYYISATPSVCYNREHAKAIAEAPLTNILLETDTPVKWKNCDAKPIHATISLNCVSKIKQLRMGIVADQTVKNTIQCFGISI